MIFFCFFIYFSFICILFLCLKLLDFKPACFTCRILNFICFSFIFTQYSCRINSFKFKTVINKEKHVKHCKNYKINVIYIIVICYLNNFRFKIDIIFFMNFMCYM